MRHTGWWWLGLAAAALLLPGSAWALRCDNTLVQQGQSQTQVRAACGEPFFVDRYVGGFNDAVDPPVGAVMPAVTRTVWYYNFGPQRLMVRLMFSGGVLAKEETLGYGFVGRGGPCDFTNVTPGMSVAELIAHCGYPDNRARNNLYGTQYLGAQGPAWGENWFYPADGSRAAREVSLQDGRVVAVRVLR